MNYQEKDVPSEILNHPIYKICLEVLYSLRLEDEKHDEAVDLAVYLVAKHLHISLTISESDQDPRQLE